MRNHSADVTYDYFLLMFGVENLGAEFRDDGMIEERREGKDGFDSKRMEP